MHKEPVLVNDEGRVLLASGLSSTSITKPSVQRAFFMNPSLSYTPLESLLLFQALRYEGIALADFKRISEQLKNVPLVRNDPTYNESRLSPDALQSLFIGLLKDEARAESARQSDHSSVDLEEDRAAINGNADGTTDSRKRKAPSPSLPTVQEAAQHAHLIPLLVSKLYARYRDNLIRTLREQERRYTSLSREVVEIKTGQWDERLKRERALAPKDSTPNASSQGTALTGGKVTDAASASAESRHQVTASLPPRTQNEPGSRETSQPIAHKPVEAAAVASIVPGSNVPADRSAAHTPLKNTIFPGPPQTQPMPPGFARSVQASPMPGAQSPYAHPHGHPRPTPGAKVALQPLQAKSASQASRASLPHHVQSPVQRSLSPKIGAPPHVQPNQSYAQQQARTPTLAAAPGDHRQGGYAGTPTHQYPQGYLPPQQYQDQRSSYPSQTTPTASGHVSQPQPAGGYMLPPFQLQGQGHAAHAQTHTPVHQSQPRAQFQHSAQPHRTQLPIGQLPPAPATAPRLQGSLSQISSIVSALNTPVRSRPKPLWKTDVRPYSNAKPTLQGRPEVEPLSPTLERRKLHGNATRALQNVGNSLDETKNQLVPVVKNPSGRKHDSTRDRSPQSTVSASADDLKLAATRSQSSVPESGPASQEDRSASNKGVKVEPATPAASSLDDDDPMPAPSTTSTRAPLARNRQGTASSTHQVRSVKRKRQETPSDAGEEHTHSPSPTLLPTAHSRRVLAPRNFAKMAATIMNDIDSHKHASYFKTAVRERDAPGYDEIILQPQHLKSIRSAITAGTRAVAAATATASDDPATPTLTRKNSLGGGGLAPGTPMEAGLATVELERTEDLEPPKAIINGTQLEKEVMRMLANAYMFNPGFDGMAEITREMYTDVERLMQVWRGSERFGDEQRHRLSLDHSAPTSSVGAGSDGKGGGGKRRKG